MNTWSSSLTFSKLRNGIFCPNFFLVRPKNLWHVPNYSIFPLLLQKPIISYFICFLFQSNLIHLHSLCDFFITHFPPGIQNPWKGIDFLFSSYSTFLHLIRVTVLTLRSSLLSLIRSCPTHNSFLFLYQFSICISNEKVTLSFSFLI